MTRSRMMTSLAALALVALPGSIGYRTTEAMQATAATPALVERGKYLVSAMGCHDCHTPWKMGPRGPEPT